MAVVPDIVDLIRRAMPSLRDSERQVAEAVLGDLNIAMTASASEIAERAGVSTASITRFCQALGFANMRDFKLCVAQNLAISAHFMANSVAPSDSYEELVRSVVDGLTGDIVGVAQSIDIARLSVALGMVSDARRILVFPLDVDSTGCAIDLFNQLLRLGTPCSCHTVPEEQRMVAMAAEPGTAAVILAAQPVLAAARELFETLALSELPTVFISPSIPVGSEFPGVQLEIATAPSAGIFARSSRRYRQSIMVDLICVGVSLKLGQGEAARRVPLVDQSAPPLKR
jgi:DNA-binding MurR/RpiR family transcriptional regulator